MSVSGKGSEESSLKSVQTLEYLGWVGVCAVLEQHNEERTEVRRRRIGIAKQALYVTMRPCSDVPLVLKSKEKIIETMIFSIYFKVWRLRVMAPERQREFRI